MADEKSPFSTPVNYGSTGGGKSTRAKLSIADLGGQQSGQTFEERKRAGRKELAIWLPEDLAAKLPELVKAYGVKFPKEAVQKALEEAVERYLT